MRRLIEGAGGLLRRGFTRNERQHSGSRGSHLNRRMQEAGTQAGREFDQSGDLSDRTIATLSTLAHKRAAMDQKPKRRHRWRRHRG